jgi:hypothetical protein
VSDEEEEPSRRGPLIAMIVVAILVAGTVYVGYRLREAARIQDCVMSGRTNCAPMGR